MYRTRKLTVTRFRGFSQFGVIGFVGMLLVWISMIPCLPALIVLVIGGVFAATQFLPPTSNEFPSVPENPGTIGYILSLFGNDGTARNTERLGGVTASGYLQNNLCDPTKVWTGIDANGKAICGTRQPLLVGTFTE